MSPRAHRSRAVAAIIAILLLTEGATCADEIKVMTSSAQQQTPFNVVEATIDDVRMALASKRVTCRGLVEQYIKRIEAYDKSGPALNAVQTINGRALQDA